MDNNGFTDFDLTPSEQYEHVGNGTKNSLQRVLPDQQKPGKKPNLMARVRNAMIKGLEANFYKIGLAIARNPIKTIIISIIIPSFLSIGIIKYKFNEDFADLLLPPSSRIFEDRAWVEKHVPYEQRPIRLILKGDNVLTRESLLGLYDMHTKISNLTVDGDHNFESMCVRIMGRCFIDSLLALYSNKREKIEKLTDEDIIKDINKVKFNPTYFFPFNATRMLGLIKRNESGHIVSAGIMHADWFIQSSIQLRSRAKKLEYKAIDVALAGQPPFDMINAFTMDSYQEEFFNGVYGDIILIVYGFPVVLLYIILALGKPNALEHGIYMTAAAIVGVILSAGACFGVGMAAGFLFGAPHQALIFLLLAVGVDDTFVIISTWNRINKAENKMSIEERVAVTMQHAGVSVMVTSFTDLVAFACGVSTQMPVLQSFCVYCSIGILFLFLMQTTLFPACLTLNQRRIEARRDGCFPCIVHKEATVSECSQKEYLRDGIKKIFAPAVLSVPGKILIILITLGLAGVMAWGVANIRKGFEIERSLPEDSYCRKFLQSQRLYFTAEGPGIQTFCGPMDYYANVKGLNDMVDQYVNSSVIMYGLVANWLSGYKLYLAITYRGKKNSDGMPVNRTEFYTNLRPFLESPVGAPFAKYLQLTDDEVPDIKWTYFPMQQVVSKDVWRNEYIMEEVRAIADNANLTDGKCFSYSLFHIFTEVIRYVETEIIRNFLLAGVAIFVVTLLLIVDLVTSFFVLVCVCLTTLDIMGTLHLWDFYLDVNVVVLLIISIGLAVDFSAHIGYTFMTITGTRKERAISTLCQIGPAILHGAATTFLVFFVLIFGRSLSAFFAVFILVVTYGLFHGLCFLPVVLSMIGPAPYDNAGPEGTESTKFTVNIEKNIEGPSQNRNLTNGEKSNKTYGSVNGDVNGKDNHGPEEDGLELNTRI